MNKRLKQLIKKHVNIVKKMYPELYIKVKMVEDDILVSIDSLDISNEEKYEDLMSDFIEEYDGKGYFNIYWGVNDTLTCDDLSMLEDFDEVPRRENSKERDVVNF